MKISIESIDEEKERTANLAPWPSVIGSLVDDAVAVQRG
jgi:hypothetical protein